jgi:hypothetical protein
MAGVNSREEIMEAVSEQRTEHRIGFMISRLRRALTVISVSVLEVNMRCACF